MAQAHDPLRATAHANRQLFRGVGLICFPSIINCRHPMPVRSNLTKRSFEVVAATQAITTSKRTVSGI